MSSTLPVTPLSQLSSFVKGQQILCIEGTVVKIYDKKEGVGDYGPWVMQDINLSDNGVEHKVTIGDAKKLLDQSHQGKRIRLSAGTDGKGQLSGLKYDVREKDGKEYRKVQVGGWAKIEQLGASGEPVKGGNTQTPTGRVTGGSGGAGGHSSGPRRGDQIGNAINNAALLLAHGFVKANLDADPLKVLENTAKEIILMSDRLMETPAAPQSTESFPSLSMGWRAVPHPSNGKKLGEMDELTLKRAIQWAFANPVVKDEHKNVRANLLLAAAELSHDYASLLVEEGADPKGLERLVQTNFEKPVAELTPDEASTLYKNIPATVKQSQESASALADDDLPGLPGEDDDSGIPF